MLWMLGNWDVFSLVVTVLIVQKSIVILYRDLWASGVLSLSKGWVSSLEGLGWDLGGLGWDLLARFWMFLPALVLLRCSLT
jgi:hypothetical protein